MKKQLLFLLLIVGCTFGASAQTTPAEFKFEKETHDFGKIKMGTPAVFEFKFTNIGDAPLLITKIEAGSNIVTDFTPTAIKKDEVGIVKVTFNPVGAALPFSKTLTITSNSKTPTKVLYIKGVMTQSID